MSKNFVETEEPQMTSQHGVYALHAGLARLYARIRMCTRAYRPISNIYCFSTATMVSWNAPQCYVIRTLALSSSSLRWTQLLARHTARLTEPFFSAVAIPPVGFTCTRTHTHTHTWTPRCVQLLSVHKLLTMKIQSFPTYMHSFYFPLLVSFKNYPITGLGMPTRLQEAEAPRITKHSANYGVKVVSLTYRPPLPPPPPRPNDYEFLKAVHDEHGRVANGGTTSRHGR
jgi:hypothetical protein